MKTGTRHAAAHDVRELEKKREELEILKKRLARLERMAANLRMDVGSIGRMYASVLEPRIRERDDLEIRLSGFYGRRIDGRLAEEDAGETVGAGFRRNESSEESLRDCCREDDAGQAESFKDLYRRVAKAIHPDLSTDEEEQKWRQRLMAEANSAYARNDRSSLRTILQQWEGSVGRRATGDYAAELADLHHKILRIGERIRVVEAEIEEIKNSDLYRLLEKVETAQAKGIDLFDEMAGRIDGEIAAFRERLRERARAGTGESYRPERFQAKSRLVRFPADRAVGRLYTRRPGSESFLDWQAFGEARGDREIPAGRSLRLDMKGRRECAGILSGMLGPDDLQALFLHGSNDRELSDARGLTGIRELYLSGKEITDAGLQILPRLTNLHRLYLYNTAVTDRGLDILKMMPGLRCATFCGSGPGEAALNTLKAKLPGCRFIILNQNTAKD